MWPAVITAVGAVLVAIVGVVALRLESFDSRSRLKRDIEILDALDRGSVAHDLMKAHVRRATIDLTAAEWWKRDRRGVISLAIWVYVASAAYVALRVLTELVDLGSFRWFAYVGVATTLMLVVVFATALVVSFWRMLRRNKRRRKEGWSFADALMGLPQSTPEQDPDRTSDS